MTRIGVLLVTAVAAVLGTAAVAVRSEQVLASGQVVYVEIRPRDPRSLVQGDYHRLRYRLEDTVAADGLPVAGELAFTLDERRVLQDARPLPGAPAAGEGRLDYRVIDGVVTVAPRSFLIEEGTGEEFQAARYAELRVSVDGRAVLVRLVDADLRPLGPAPRGW